MKKQFLGLSLLTAFLSVSAFAAGPVANIQVTGDIKPPTCTVNGLEQNDVIFDLGNIGLGMIPQSSNYSLPLASVKNEIIIQCDAQTYLTFTSSTPYSYTGTATNTYNSIIALVDASDTSKQIGYYSFMANTISVDGNTAYLSSTTNSNSYLSLGDTVKGWTKTSGNNTPIDSWDWFPGQEFKMTVQNSTTFSKIYSKEVLEAAGVNVTDGFDFIGEQILTFNFGI